MQVRLNAQMSQHPLLVSTIGWAGFGLCCVVLVGYALHGLALVWDLTRQLRVDDHGVAYVLDAQDRVIGHSEMFRPAFGTGGSAIPNARLRG